MGAFWSTLISTGAGKVALWACGILLAALAALGTAYWTRGVEVRSARADLGKAKNQIEAAKFTIQKQAEVLDECSKRTDALKAESDKKAAAAAQELARARQEASKYQAANKRLEALRAAKTPQGAGCSDALREIRAGAVK